MIAASVDDLIVEKQIADVMENSQAHGWHFERVDSRRFRVCLSAHNGDVYQLEVGCESFPVLPPSFHWRNRETGRLDDVADSPAAYGYFHDGGRICAPWNLLASTEGGPHLEWVPTSWQRNGHTGGTVTLPAMVLRIHHELRRSDYRGRRR